LALISLFSFLKILEIFYLILFNYTQQKESNGIRNNSLKIAKKPKNRFEIFLYKFVGTDSKKNLKNHDRGQGAITTIFLQTIKQFKYVIGAEELFENFVWITELGRSFAAGQFTFEK